MTKAQTKTEEFRRWFGDSKVVDERGEPLVVYHGTGARPFSEFIDWRPMFFTTEREYASGYTGKAVHGRGRGRIVSAYLSIQRPFDTRVDQHRRTYNEVFVPWARSRFTARDASGRPSSERFAPLAPGELQSFIAADHLFSFLKTMEREGKLDFDGMYVDEGSFLSSPTISPLRATQIKSATGNVGTFDPEDPDIMKNPPSLEHSMDARFPADLSEDQRDELASLIDGTRPLDWSVEVLFSNDEEERGVSAWALYSSASAAMNASNIVQRWAAENGVRASVRHKSYDPDAPMGVQFMPPPELTGGLREAGQVDRDVEQTMRDVDDVMDELISEGEIDEDVAREWEGSRRPPPPAPGGRPSLKIVKNASKLAGRFHFVTSCVNSTYEDISALKESETSVSLATFRSAIGTEQWRETCDSLGYDRYLPISKDWHVGYYKGVYRHVPAYFLRHSGIEYIFTLDGEQGASHSDRTRRP